MLGIKKFFVSCVRKRPIWGESDTGRPKITGYTYKQITGYKGSQTDIPQFTAGKYTIKSQFKFFCDDFDILMGDFLSYEDNVYEIIGVPKNTAHKANHIRIMIEKIENLKQY